MKPFLFASAFLLMQCLAFAQEKRNLIVHFDFDKYDLTPEAVAKLDSFISNINNPGIISITLSGHCDSKGTDAYNDVLSLNRVNKVKDYLEKQKSIPAATITVSAFGEKKLLNADISETEGYQNRRVEIVATIKPVPVEVPVVEEKKENKSLTTILEDTAIKAGTTITLPNLNFENNSDILIPTSIPTLKELLDILNKNPKIKISVEGHICCVSMVNNVPYERLPNYQISVLRAKMVYDYLLDNGISSDRVLGYKGFGSSQPVFPIPEKTEEERIANRRVEIRIAER